MLFLFEKQVLTLSLILWDIRRVTEHLDLNFHLCLTPLNCFACVKWIYNYIYHALKAPNQYQHQRKGP